MTTSFQSNALQAAVIAAEDATFIGIDFHKRYSVWDAVMSASPWL